MTGNGRRGKAYNTAGRYSPRPAVSGGAENACATSSCRLPQCLP